LPAANDDEINVVVTQPEANDEQVKEQNNVSPIAPELTENTQELKSDPPTIETSIVQDEQKATAQEMLTNKETSFNMQEESKELVVALPTPNVVEQEYITELPTLQEEIATPQEFTEIITSKNSSRYGRATVDNETINFVYMSPAVAISYYHGFYTHVLNYKLNIWVLVQIW